MLTTAMIVVSNIQDGYLYKDSIASSNAILPNTSKEQEFSDPQIEPRKH